MLIIAASGQQWLSFNAREDRLHGLTVGSAVQVARAGAREMVPAVVTEMPALGAFATWQAERAVGDHDLNTLRPRLDLQGDAAGLEPGHDGLAAAMMHRLPASACSRFARICLLTII